MKKQEQITSTQKKSKSLVKASKKATIQAVYDIQQELDYESLFIRPTLVCGRQEKTTYLRKEFYNRIMKVLVVYQNPKLSVFAYVDAVLEHHFEVYKQEIMEIYQKKESAAY